MLIAGALLAEAYAMGEADAEPYPALSHIGFDEVLALATKLQLFLETEGPGLEDPEFDALAFARERMAEVVQVEIDHVKPIGRGSAYFAFDDEGDYRSKLADYLLGVERWPDMAVWQRAFDELQSRAEGPLPPFEEALRVIAQASFEHWVHRPEPLLEMALAQFALEPELARRFEETSRRARIGTDDEPGLNSWFAQFLDRYERVPAPGITLDQLTTVLMCLTYGFLFGARSDPPSVSQPVDWSGQSTSLHALTVEAVVSYLTTFTSRAADGADKRPQ